MLRKIKDWGNSHHPAFIDGLRVMLGVFLLLKGYAFLQNMAYLKWILSTQQLTSLSAGALSFIMFYVIFSHMAGGILIMLGILTRLAALVQLPVIVCSVLIINSFKSTLNTQMWLSVLCCILLLFFLLMGSGPFSLDNYFTKSQTE
jgi:putative oxidoreductase